MNKPDQLEWIVYRTLTCDKTGKSCNQIQEERSFHVVEDNVFWMCLPLRILLEGCHQGEQNVDQDDNIDDLFLSEILFIKNLFGLWDTNIGSRLSMDIPKSKPYMNRIDEVTGKDGYIDHSFPSTQPAWSLWMNDDVQTWHITCLFRSCVANFVDVLLLLDLVNFQSLHVLLSLLLLLV